MLVTTSVWPLRPWRRLTIVHVVPKPGVRWLDADGIVVVLEPRRRRFVELSESGSELWSALVDHQFDLRATARYVGEEFELSRTDAESVIGGVVRQLIDAGILSTDSASDEPPEPTATLPDVQP